VRIWTDKLRDCKIFLLLKCCSLRDKIAKHRYWPLEVFRIASAAPTGKAAAKGKVCCSCRLKLKKYTIFLLKYGSMEAEFGAVSFCHPVPPPQKRFTIFVAQPPGIKVVS